MSDTVIQLFAKLPIAGEVKTRLIPQIGQDHALSVYRHCLQNNLQLIRNSRFNQQLWLNRKGNEDWLNSNEVHIQQGLDLGEKMLHAMRHGFTQYRNCIIIGSDCLDLNQKILNRVHHKLQDYDLVIIPALDGGYVLIAARDQIDSAVFSSIPWSTQRVLIQTLEKCMQQKIKTFILNPLRDIDYVEDLKHYPELETYLN